MFDLIGNEVLLVDSDAVSAVIEEGKVKKVALTACMLHAEVLNDFERDNARPSLVQADLLDLKRTDFPF